MNKLKRADIIACNWAWTALNQAKAYHTCIMLLRHSGCKDEGGVAIANNAYRAMMRYHATDAIRLARAYGPQR